MALGGGICEVWWTRVADREVDWTLLDEAERKRAEEFRVGHARQTFITSRAAQRRIAAAYLDCSIADVVIGRQCEYCGVSHGRPVISGAPFDFSVSHTAAWVAIAVTADGRIGLDVEDRRTARTCGIDAVALCSQEAQALASVPEATRPDWLLRAWTRKEAATKLTGHGLTADVSRLDVSEEVVVWQLAPTDWAAAQIRLVDLIGPDLHIGALATTFSVHAIRHFGLPHPEP
jgi:4'-phosphopantetheinyl transferase